MIQIKPIASGSKGNCYYITDGKTPILLDCGISYEKIEIATDFKLHEIAGVFVTHRHGDHAKSVKKLVEQGTKVLAPLDVFKSAGVSGCYTLPLNDGDVIIVKSWTVKAFSCQHDVPCLGYLMRSKETGETLVYFTDTYYVKYTFPEVNYILAECNHSIDGIDNSIAAGRIGRNMKNRLMQSHMSIDTLEQMLKANDLSKVKQIWLLHLSDNNSNEAEFKQRIKQLTGCEVYVC